MQASQEHLVLHVLPLLVRAYDDNDARMQEEGLKRTSSLAKQLDAQVIVTCHSYFPCAYCSPFREQLHDTSHTSILVSYT